ncbi:26632_t:CDS:2 [Racocetra persica]|uniref:26632_t:CDS:1 n=1 Tax=Racocetra persica TaxID=160502 RepID=A0ACA9S6D9_9GLOM|nr:26632_t:CDS:2 [Racocetra persica]
MLENSVEADETFVGDKIPVLGIIERGGNLITQTIPNTKQETVNPIIRANVKEGSDVFTDE